MREPDGIAALRGLMVALRMDKPWPCVELLRRLADAADHLLDVHDCDAHGWEGVRIAAGIARVVATDVDAALAAAERPTPAEETAYRAGFRAGRSAERAYGETLAPWAEDSAWTDYTDYTHEAAVFVNPLREAGAQARASVSVLLRSVARAQVLPPQAAPKSSPPASGAKHSAAPPAQEEQP